MIAKASKYGQRPQSHPRMVPLLNTDTPGAKTCQTLFPWLEIGVREKSSIKISSHLEHMFFNKLQFYPHPDKQFHHGKKRLPNCHGVRGLLDHFCRELRLQPIARYRTLWSRSNRYNTRGWIVKPDQDCKFMQIQPIFGATKLPETDLKNNCTTWNRLNKFFLVATVSSCFIKMGQVSLTRSGDVRSKVFRKPFPSSFPC